MSLLAVPRRPAANQTSTISQSLRGKRVQMRRDGGAPSASTMGVPRMIHLQASLPLENDQSPSTKYPPCTGRAWPELKLKAVPTRVSGSLDQTASCASAGNIPRHQAWQATTHCTHALEPQPRPRTLHSSVWVRP